MGLLRSSSEAELSQQWSQTSGLRPLEAPPHNTRLAAPLVTGTIGRRGQSSSDTRHINHLSSRYDGLGSR